MVLRVPGAIETDQESMNLNGASENALELHHNGATTNLQHDEFGAIDPLLDYLNRTRGFDFTGYKRASLVRRIHKRMQTVGVLQYEGYVDFLEVHSNEFNHLFNTILINVTAFFRDPQSWEYLNKELLDRITARKSPDPSIRVWSAGCASGEEAYTLAILMAECLGIEQFRERVKIYCN